MVEVANVMRSVAAEGVAVLVITHDMDLVAECCDRALVLEEGHVRFEGLLDEEVLCDAVAYLKLSHECPAPVCERSRSIAP